MLGFDFGWAHSYQEDTQLLKTLIEIPFEDYKYTLGFNKIYISLFILGKKNNML